jgi:hypothetical protein
LTQPEESGPRPARGKKHRKRASGTQAEASAGAHENVTTNEATSPDTGPPAAEIAHHVRGRVRLKIAAAKHNPGLLEQIKTTFGSVPGIEYIEVRPSSGSVILYYDPERHVDVPSLFRSLSGPLRSQDAAQPVRAAQRRRPPPNLISDVDRQIEDEAEFLAEHSTFAKTIVEYAKEMDRQLKRATNNNIDLKILVPIGLAAVTFLEIGAAAATPMWVTLVIFSLNHFVELHAHDSDSEPT